MPHDSRFSAVISRVYYVLGAGYYIYHWLLGSGVGSFLLTALQLVPTVPGTVVGTILFVPGALYWVNSRRREVQSLNPSLDILSETAVYETDSSGGYIYIRRLEVQSRQNGISTFRTKFKWTGEGCIAITSPHTSHTVQHTPAVDGVWDLCEVKLPNELRKGEKQAIEIRMEISEVRRAPLPLLVRHVDEHYRGGLTLEVILPRENAFRHAAKEIYLSDRVMTPFKRYPEALDPATHIVEWRIPRPRLGCTYKITWW